MLKKPIDHLVLGCTHYPFLTPALKKILPENVTIVDCSTAVAEQTRRLLGLHNLYSESGGRATYYSTACPKIELWESFGVDHVNQVAI
jgi:glutamate racemase